MRVLLKDKWFGPTVSSVHNVLYKINGRRWPKGEHTMPDELKPHLPKHAVILDEKAKFVEKEVVKTGSLKEFDELRQQDELVEKRMKELMIKKDNKK